jgi:hypothetical protein
MLILVSMLKERQFMRFSSSYFGKSNAVQVGGWDEPVSCANGGFNLLFAGSTLSGIHNAVAGAIFVRMITKAAGK